VREEVGFTAWDIARGLLSNPRNEASRPRLAKSKFISYLASALLY
jgi:hypothetical protein